MVSESSSHTSLAPAKAREPRSRLAVAAVSFRDWFPQTPKVFTSGRTSSRKMSLCEFSRFVADELDLHQVSVMSIYFEDVSAEYCRAVRESARAAGVDICNLQLEFVDADLASTDDDVRRRSLDVVRRWMDRAAEIGCPRVRANPDLPTPGRPFDADRIADSYRRLAEHGEDIGVDILVENHFGYSAVIDNVMAIYDRVDHRRFKIVADWGNSPAESFEQRIADLMQMTRGVALVDAKGLQFDDSYRHVAYDVPEIVRATEAAGYDGTYCIELFTLEGDMPADPVRAVKAMADEITSSFAASDAAS